MSRTGYLAASLFRHVQAGLQARISSSAEPCGSAGSSAKASPAVRSHSLAFLTPALRRQSKSPP